MRLKISTLLTTVALTLLAGTTPLTAQWRTEATLPVSPTPSIAVGPTALRVPDSLRVRRADGLTLGLAGVAGAAVGTLGGAFLGYQLQRNAGGEYGGGDGSNGLLIGWIVGSALTTPVSVHRANGEQGSLSSAYRSAALIAGAGVAGLLVLGAPEIAFVLVGAPVAQVISAVLIERRSAR